VIRTVRRRISSIGHFHTAGNPGAGVFLDDEDRRAYPGLPSKYGQRHGVEIWAYCFMTNHVHLIAVPGHEAALARALHDAHSVYGVSGTDYR
jgi:putative transposase